MSESSNVSLSGLIEGVEYLQRPRSCRELGLLALAADAEGAGSLSVFHSSKFPTRQQLQVGGEQGDHISH